MTRPLTVNLNEGCLALPLSEEYGLAASYPPPLIVSDLIG